MPYTEKVMVASGVPFTPDEEHPYPPNPEEVEFETIPSGGGSSFDPNTLPVSTNTPADANEIITSESGTWYRKAFSKVWDYISLKLGIFIGTSATWEAKTTEEKDTYNLIFITDDNINSQTSYDIPHNQTNVGHTLDLSLNDFTTVTEQTTALDDGTTETLKTYWQTAPTASNDVYGVSVYGGKLWRVHNELGTYSARRYDYDSTYNGSTLYTNSAKTGSGTTVTKTISAGTSMDNAIGTLLNNDSALNSAKQIATSNNKVTIYKVGRICILNIYFGGNVTYTSTGWQDIVTVPDTAFPIFSTDFLGFDNSTGTFADNKVINCRLSPAGALKVYVFSDKKTFNLMANVMYISAS